MKGIDFPDPVKTMIGELRRLPGLGPRSAERMAVWLLQDAKASPESLTQAILDATSQIHPCSECGFFTHEDPCKICTDDQRKRELLCVVEQATDILKIERSGAFQGLYHCLGGKLSPLDDIGPDELRIRELLQRVDSLGTSEVILATSSDVEGEATSNFLREELAQFPHCRVTRIAQGLPAGGGLDHADELTLLRAITDRR